MHTVLACSAPVSPAGGTSRSGARPRRGAQLTMRPLPVCSVPVSPGGGANRSGAQPPREAQLTMRTLPACLLLVLAACGPNRTFPDRAAYTATAAAPLPCLPNLDGAIDASELQAALGVPASYLVSPAAVHRAVDLTGGTDAQGRRVWDLSADYADDQLAHLTASALTGKWYAGTFPSGEFVAPLDAAGSIEGVYVHSTTSLALLGYATAQQNPGTGQTLVHYTLPVELYRFPLTPGMDWVTVGEVRNSTVRGLPYAGRDTYHVRVDAAGALDLPDLTFTQALRVRTDLSIEPSVGTPITRKQVGFLFECFGEVARATSLDGETVDDFTTTSELRRLGY
jgi:hypothetical protein